MSAPFDAPGRWVADQRGDGRGVRVSAHTEAGFLVLSTWKAGVCVGTVHLLPDEAAELVAGVADGLAELTRPADPARPAGPTPAAAPVPERGSIRRLLRGR